MLPQKEKGNEKMTAKTQEFFKVVFFKKKLFFLF